MPVSVSIGKLDALTNKHFIKNLEDEIFLTNILWFYFKKRLKQAGGRDIRLPIRHSKNSTAGRWGMGGATVSTTGQNNETQAIFPWRGYSVSMVLDNTDIAQNSGAEQIVDLLEEETANARETLMDNLDIDTFLSGELVAGNPNKGMQGLNAAITYSTDNGVTGGYGGITRVGATGSKNVPVGNAFWNAGVVMKADANTTTTFWRTDVTMDNSTTLTLAKLFELAGAVGQPDLYVTSQLLYNKYASLLTTIQREMVDDEVGKSGFTSLQFCFKPIVVAYNIDDTSRVYALTMRDWDLYALRGYDMKITPFKTPINSDQIVKQIYAVYAPICRRPNDQGYLYDLTAT